MTEAAIEEEEEQQGGGLVKIILIVLVVLLLMVATAVGTMFATGFFSEPEEGQDPDETLESLKQIEETEGQIEAAPGPMTEIEQKFLISYYTFEEAFTVNLKGSKKVMQAKLGVSTYFDKDTMFNAEEGSEDGSSDMVGIRAAIGRVLRNVTDEKIKGVGGEAEVLEEVRLVINEQLERHEKTTSAPIEEVYFTELIVQ